MGPMAPEAVLLGRGELEDLLPPADAVAVVEACLAQLGRGGVEALPKARLRAPTGDGFFTAMPALVPSAGMAGVKWVGSFAANRARGLPTVAGALLLSDVRTGVLRGVLEAGGLTGLRTGAMVAAAARHLGSEHLRTVAFVGAGEQARGALACLQAILPELRRVRVVDPRAEAVRAFLAVAHGTVDVEVASSARSALAGAELAVVATTARAPVLGRDAVAPGMRVVALGSGPELEDGLVLSAEALVVDDWAQHVEGGGLAHLIAKGVLRRSRLYGELGELVAGVRSPPPAEALVVASLLGLAALDVALGAEAVRRAEAAGVGRRLRWPDVKRTEGYP
jgi:alanine dehydrogenase